MLQLGAATEVGVTTRETNMLLLAGIAVGVIVGGAAVIGFIGYAMKDVRFM